MHFSLLNLGSVIYNYTILTGGEDGSLPRQVDGVFPDHQVRVELDRQRDGQEQDGSQRGPEVLQARRTVRARRAGRQFNGTFSYLWVNFV